MNGKGLISDIAQLIAEFEASDLRELQLRHGDFEIYLSHDADAAGLDPAPAGSAPSRANPAVAPAKTPAGSGDAAPGESSGPAATAAPGDDFPAGATFVRAPTMGTFYRAPKPGAAPYVEVGQPVSEASEVCLVEVMKLFTAVRAGCAGKVHAVLADDAEMVAADQPLFVIVPA